MTVLSLNSWTSAETGFLLCDVCQVFTAAVFRCCLCVALSVFSLVFSVPIRLRSGDWLSHCRILHFFTFKNSWVAFAVCFGSSSICTLVTELTRREASESKCKLLLLNIVKTQAGSNNSKRVWHEQDTRVILGQAWIFNRWTISRGLDQRGNLITWAVVQAGANRVTTRLKRDPRGYKLQGRKRSDKKRDTQAKIKIRMTQTIN